MCPYKLDLGSSRHEPDDPLLLHLVGPMDKTVSTRQGMAASQIFWVALPIGSPSSHPERECTTDVGLVSAAGVRDVNATRLPATEA